MDWEAEIESAIRFYLDIGASMIPIRYGDKRPDASALPNGSWKPFQTRRPTEAELVEWFFSGVKRNVAVVLGSVSGNLFVLDLDSPELVKYVREKVPEFFSNTLVVESGRGAHIYLRGSQPVPTMKFQTPYGELDIKGEGGYVLAPPSKHPSGKFYRFLSKKPPMNAFIPGKASTQEFLEVLFEQLFPDLVEELKSRFGQFKSAQTTSKVVFPDMPPCLKSLLKGVGEGQRNNAAFLLAAYLTKIMPVELVEQLLLQWNARNKPPLPENELLRTIHSAARYEISCRAIKRYITVPLTMCYHCPYRAYMASVDELYKVEVAPQEVKMEETPAELKKYVFVPTLRPGQLEVIEELLSSEDQNIILKAPTGWGKTIAFLAKAMAVGGALIVEPYRALQDQLQEKYGLLVVKGKNAYQCPLFDVPADIAPCNFARNGHDELWEEIRAKLKEFGAADCMDVCPYKQAVAKAKSELAAGGVVVVNHGNMPLFYGYSKYLVIDEFHKVVEQWGREIRLQHVKEADLEKHSLDELLKIEAEALKAEAEKLEGQLTQYDPRSSKYQSLAQQVIRVKRKVETLERLIEDIDHVIAYSRKLRTGETALYVKKEEPAIVKSMLSWKKPKLLVSATPPVVPKDVPVRLIEAKADFLSKTNAPIIYFPVAKLTTWAVRGDDAPLKKAADFIKLVYGYLKNNGGTRKAIVHSGNTHRHGRKLAKYLQPYKVILHEKGKLDETLRRFKESDADFLVVASGDVGFDFYGEEYSLQFIAKVPFPALDEEWRARIKRYGERKAMELYNKKTVDTIVQIVGRISRGGDDVGYTIILDSKFEELFEEYFDYFGEDFLRRLVDVSPNRALYRIMKERGWGSDGGLDKMGDHKKETAKAGA